MPLISAVVMAMALVLLPFTPASAAITQGISGKVTGTGGTPLPGIEVAFFLDFGNGFGYINSTATDASGNYQAQLPAGSWRVGFADFETGEYITEFWDDSPTFAGATTVVTGTQVTTGIDAQLAQGGHIVGHAAGGSSGWVDAFTESSPGAGDWEPTVQGYVDPSGDFDIGGLPTGDYRLEFHVDNFAPEFWEDEADVASATSIAVTAPETVSGINPTLTPTGHITGHVENADGAPIPDVFVAGYVLEGGEWVFAGVFGTLTDLNGDYDFSAPAGTYRLQFMSFDNGYAGEYFDDSSSLDGATEIAVASAQTVTGKDAVLAVESTLSGTVTLPEGADPEAADGSVDVYDTASGEWVGGTWLDPADETAPGSGAYDFTVGGLAAGSYRVEFARFGDASTSEAEFYDNHPESAGADSADPVALTTGEHEIGIDATLTEGGTISGTLVDGAGDPVVGCQVVAFTPTETLSARSGVTGADGGFVVTGLTTGDYGLGFAGFDEGTACPTPEYYTNENGDLSESFVGLLPVSAAPGADHAITTPLVYGGEVADPSVTAGDPTVPSAAPIVGNPVTATPGTWGPAPVTLAYQWSADDVEIAGATAESYTPVVGDIGKTLSVTVTGSKPGFTSASATSNSTAAVVAASGAVANTVAPSLPAGAPIIGMPVAVNPGTWTPDNVELSYQWKTNGNAIAGATSASYTPKGADFNKALSVEVTGSKPGLTPATKTATASAPVTGAVFATLPPAVVGIPRVGETLSSYDGLWFPLTSSTSRQWLRNGVPVAGATGPTYALGVGDVGARISLRVTATFPDALPSTVTSEATDPVIAGPLTLTDVPRIFGVLKVGKVLRAVAPTSTPAATSVRYQWLRNGVPIKRAAAKRARYQLVRADRGRKISVRVTVERPGYASTESVARRPGRVR